MRPRQVPVPLPRRAVLCAVALGALLGTSLRTPLRAAAPEAPSGQQLYREGQQLYLEGWYLETAERQPAKALEAYRRLLEATPTGRLAARARIRVALCLRALGQGAEARRALEEVLERHREEADLVARARRLLEGDGTGPDEGPALLDPRTEILSLVEDLRRSESEERTSGSRTANQATLTRFAAILRLATPEYVRDVVLPKHPGLPRQVRVEVSRRGSLPPIDAERLLSYATIPRLRPLVFDYLVRLDDPGAGPLLARLLDSSDEDLRVEAAGALGELGVREAAPRILEILRAEEPPDSSSPALAELAGALGRLRHGPAVVDLVRLHDAGDLGPATAAEALGRIGTDKAIEALLPILGSPDPEVRRSAWGSLELPADGADGAEAAARVLRPALAAEDEELRLLASVAACRSLPEAGEATRALLPEVARALSRAVEGAARSDLPESLASWDTVHSSYAGRDAESGIPNWIEWCMNFVQAAPPELSAPLFRELIDSPPLRGRALEFFARHWDTLPDLFDVLRKGDPDVARDAVATTPAVGTLELWRQALLDASIPVDRRIALLHRSPLATEVRGANAGLLAKQLLGGPEAALVIAALDVLRETAVAGRMGPSERTSVGETVRALLEDPERAESTPAARSAGLELLAALGDEEGCALAMRDPLPRIRRRAAEILAGRDAAYREAARRGERALDVFLLEQLRATRLDFERRRPTRGFSSRSTRSTSPTSQRIDPSGDLEAMRNDRTAARVAWARRLGWLAGSTRTATRSAALELLAEARADGDAPRLPADLARPIATAAIEDPEPSVRSVAYRVLSGLGDPAPLLAAWEDLLEVAPAIALDAARAGGREDLVLSLRDHPDAAVRDGVAWYRRETAEPGELVELLAEPSAKLRASVVDEMRERLDLAGLAAALADPDVAIARSARAALAAFSGEVRGKLDAAGITGEEFPELPAEARGRKGAEVAGWIREKGTSLRVGRGRELLDRSDAAGEVEVPGGEESATVDARRRGTEILCAALPDEAAATLLSTHPAVRVEIAAPALAAAGLRSHLAALCTRWEGEEGTESRPWPPELILALGEAGVADALERLSRRLMAIPTPARWPTELPAQLAANGLGGSLRSLADGMRSRDDAGGAEGKQFLLATLRELARSKDVEAAHEGLSRFAARFTLKDHAKTAGKVVAASGAAGPEGPDRFFDLIAGRPEHPELARGLVEAYEACESEAGLRRCLEELPRPPVGPILRALIAIGRPELVLGEAGGGELWYEAAAALRDATGEWAGYFGPDRSATLPPAKLGYLRVTFASGLSPRSVRNSRSPRVSGIHVEAAWREAAVAAWRARLAGTAPEDGSPRR